MKPETHHQPTLTHGRYLVVPAAEEPAAGLLVGFHGYGETAAEHLAELRRIPGVAGWHLAAVQALHPFYTRRGKIVASWMTAQDRELAIEDNVRYTAAVVSRLRRRFSEPEGGAAGRLVYAGFSQGVAMAWRATAGSGHPCDGLIALAGDVPPEVGEGRLPCFPPVLLGRGTGDEWYSEAKMEADLEVLARRGVAVTPHVFAGGHVWADEFLAAAGEFLAALR